MERKTEVIAESGRQDMLITRTFDIPVDLLFRAYEDAGIVEEWMGTKVLKLENRKHGSWRFETSDPGGNVVFAASGVFHAFEPGVRIVRTFEMENASFGVQLEVLDFAAVAAETSRLRIHAIYESVEQRDALLKLPFAHGINMAHNRLETLVQNRPVHR